MRRALQRRGTRTCLTRHPQSLPDSKSSCFDGYVRDIYTSSFRAPEGAHDVQEQQRQHAPEPSVDLKSLATRPTYSTVPITRKLSWSRGNRCELTWSRGNGWDEPDLRNKHRAESIKGQDSQSSISQGSSSFPRNTQDPDTWSTLLESVRARRRHFGLTGAWHLYLAIIKKKLDMPTEGKRAAELWEHFIQTGSSNPRNLFTVAEYVVELHQRTGMARPDIYQSILGSQMWRDPHRALELHQTLKDHFPPGRDDFAALLRLSLEAGPASFMSFEKIYLDHPVQDLYPIVVPELCQRGMRTEATKWHFLLVERDDLPHNFYNCKPLFQHYSHLKNDKTLEAIARSLVEKQLWFRKDVENFVQDDKASSREIMNRALSAAHNINPKPLSDAFCARLIATKFFSVELVLNGLQIVGLESLGPSAVRELVIRDAYDCVTVVKHVMMLQEGGIALQKCRYNAVVKQTAVAGQTKLLKSMASTDLHPDTFEDIDLQERLLAMYCEREDRVQMDRTLAVFRSTTPERAWDTYRANLLLRCHVSLRNRAQVLSILSSMHHKRFPLAPRSTRHLRTLYLAPRRAGARPLNSRQALKDITLMVNVMKMSLQSGYSMPIDAWREILKRLGMMGHLDRYQTLALWLVNWYSRSVETEAENVFDSANPLAGLATSLAHLEIAPLDILEFGAPIEPLEWRGNSQTQNRDLLKLFGTDAQQAMIAWGFQAEVKRHPSLSSLSKIRYGDTRTPWQWGLRLLKELERRGVPVNRTRVAHACRLRLAQLFGLTRVSKKNINRRARTLNDERSKLIAKFRYGAYVKGIEEIWGRDLLLLHVGAKGLDRGVYGAHKAQLTSKRYFRHLKTR